MASIEYHPKNILSVKSITVVDAMLPTRGRLILNTSLYPLGQLQRFSMKNTVLSLYILQFLSPRGKINLYVSELKNGSHYPTAITLLRL
jgi:hypothetical protein